MTTTFTPIHADMTATYTLICTLHDRVEDDTSLNIDRLTLTNENEEKQQYHGGEVKVVSTSSVHDIHTSDVTFSTPVTGTGCNVPITLSSSTLTVPPTYIHLESQRSVFLCNDSTIPITFNCCHAISTEYEQTYMEQQRVQMQEQEQKERAEVEDKLQQQESDEDQEEEENDEDEEDRAELKRLKAMRSIDRKYQVSYFITHVHVIVVVHYLIYV